jgi:eukaryotic-like serine/threonine-protein kinase
MSDTTVQNEPHKEADVSAPPPPPQPPAGEKKSALTGEVVFNESISVYAGNRLPQYDKGPVKAYVARGRDKAPPYLFALICEDHLTPRTLKASNYAAIINPSLVRLVASGVIDWPPAGKQKYCFIYENTLGNAFMPDDTRGGLGLKSDLVLANIIRPMVNVLADMRDKDFVHGNIRLSNIYDGGARNFERAILGEGLSMPVSSHQPALYEPIERAMANPIGRGAGTPQDDLYSFGVCLAIMLRHHDPTEGLSDSEIVTRKMEDGTYAVLLGRDRLTGGILELMRGLLYDDKAQRWTLDEVLVWLDGRRLSPKQASRRSKASRPVTFMHEKFTRPELLAAQLHKDTTSLRELVEGREIEQWLSRALEDKVMTARYEAALKQAEEGGKTGDYADRLATRVAIALHPEGPLRYKSISVFPEGAGIAFTEAYVMKRDVQMYVDFFMNYFITQWIDAQATPVPDVSGLISRFDGARAYLRNKSLGGGIEKCIYSMNPEVHCLSEKLAKFHVRSPEEMMQAFEKISKEPGRPSYFFDRHSAAFLSAKDRKNIDPYLHEMNMPEPYRRIMAEMRTLATIQKRSQMEKFPGIARWLVDNLGPVYERYHDRQLRDELKTRAEKMVEMGDLAKIVYLFEEQSVYQEDNVQFRRAMRRYFDLEEEMKAIEKSLMNEATVGREMGHQVAAIFSSILAGIIILVSAFTMF